MACMHGSSAYSYIATPFKSFLLVDIRPELVFGYNNIIITRLLCFDEFHPLQSIVLGQA